MPSPQPQLDALVTLFSALGDATRLSVLELLANKPRAVHDLSAAFDISRPAISRHLRVLKDAGLVVEEKRGRENVYALVRPQLGPMAGWLAAHTAERAPAAPKAKSAPGRTAKRNPALPALPKRAAKGSRPRTVPPQAAKPPRPARGAETPVTVPPPQMGFDF